MNSRLLTNAVLGLIPGEISWIERSDTRISGHLHGVALKSTSV